jgi:hypothetical protein
MLFVLVPFFTTRPCIDIRLFGSVSGQGSHHPSPRTLEDGVRIPEGIVRVEDQGVWRRGHLTARLRRQVLRIGVEASVRVGTVP